MAASGFRTSSAAQVEPRYGARRVTSAIPENKMTPATQQRPGVRPNPLEVPT